ncbi:MAG: GNAT family N-acetyltransferase, partial [Candidatus Dormibacteria bacterium]
MGDPRDGGTLTAMLSTAQFAPSAHLSLSPAVEVTLDSGLTLRLRPIRPSDKDGLRRGFDRLSDTSRYRRFLSPMNCLPEDMVVRFTEIDYVDHFAWVALDSHRPHDPGVAVARYIRNSDAPHTADVAVAVVDEYHGLGVGTLLMRMLWLTALGSG